MGHYPGFSGSPVFLYETLPEGIRYELIGIDTGHYLIDGQVFEIIDQSQGQAWTPSSKLKTRLDTGVSIVSPVWKIEELLMGDILTEEREKAYQSWLEKLDS